MDNLVPFRRPTRVPTLARNTIGYPILFGLTSIFFCAFWAAQAAEAFQGALDMWTGKKPNPDARIVPKTVPVPVVIPLFHQ